MCQKTWKFHNKCICIIHKEKLFFCFWVFFMLSFVRVFQRKIIFNQLRKSIRDFITLYLWVCVCLLFNIWKWKFIIRFSFCVSSFVMKIKNFTLAAGCCNRSDILYEKYIILAECGKNYSVAFVFPYQFWWLMYRFEIKTFYY